MFCRNCASIYCRLFFLFYLLCFFFRGKQLRECGICLERKQLSMGLECGEKHYTCNECTMRHATKFHSQKSVAQLTATQAKVATHTHTHMTALRVAFSFFVNLLLRFINLCPFCSFSFTARNIPKSAKPADFPTRSWSMCSQKHRSMHTLDCESRLRSRSVLLRWEDLRVRNGNVSAGKYFCCFGCLVLTCFHTHAEISLRIG